MRDTRRAAPRAACSILAAALSLAAAAQEPAQAAAPAPAAPPAQASAAPAARTGLEPVFPAEVEGLAFVEGEEAVSTNMAAAPTQNYGCSGDRALQLSRGGKLPGDRPFYAEYVLRVEKAGSYELWYGGTPPGPKDEFALSLSSPFSVVVDGGAPRSIHREDVNVVEQYAPAYYWVRAATLDLAEGSHVIRFEVNERRRLDDRWFFYLDALFLADRGALAAMKGGAGRAPGRILPADPDSRAIDKPFRSVEDYQAYIQANPGSLPAYLELSSIYSLSGDYLSALKTLSRAQAVAPKDPQARLLIAKNRIWRGDSKDGLDAYKTYLQLKPDDLAGYAEAGKVAAWVGRYADSKGFYSQGLQAFPGDPSLQVNLGLTQLWASEVRDAEKSFSAAESAALAADAGPGATGSGEASLRLASIYRNSGYADKALAFYEKAISARPEVLAFYLGESEIYADKGDAADAQAVESRIAKVFAPSDRLSAYLASFVSRRDLKSERIAAIEKSVSDRPDDLELREDLTRVYFWNGFKEKAVLQLESILSALFVASLDESDAQAPELAAVAATAGALRADAGLRLARLGKLALDADAASKRAAQAGAAQADWEKRYTAAKAAADAAANASPPPKAMPKVPPESEGEALAAAKDAAAEAAASAVEALAVEESRVAALVERAAALRESFAPVTDREQELEKGFRAINEASGWAWDAKAAAAELGGPASRGEGIAAYGRSRILEAAGDPKAGLAALAGASAPALATRRRAAEYELRGRIDHRESRELARKAAEASDLPPGSALEAAAKELALVDSAAPAEAGADLSSLVAALPALRRSVADAQADLAVLAQSCALLRDRRAVRAWRSFEESSAYRRAELGAYYDSLGQAEKAAAQYRRVLAVDPGNLPAMYNLALAEDRAGDWRSASRLLRSVYDADPDYGNAASAYNRIARLRASGFDLDASLGADLNRLSTKSGASLRFPLSSLASLGLRAGLDSIRDLAYGLPAYLAGSLELELPIALVAGDAASVVVRPSGSILGTSAAYASTSAASVTPSDFLSGLNLYSAGGAAVDARAGGFYGTASYRWEPIAATLDPSRFPLYAHRAELSGGAYLPLSGAFRYFAPRIYGVFNAVPTDGNAFGTALVELVPAFRLSDSPWANLGIPLSLVYEDSKTARNTPYFAADSALTAKGGLLWQSTFPLREGDSISATVQGMGGVYQTGTASLAPDRYLYLQLFGRCEWAAAGATYWLSFEATSAGDPLEPDKLAYWSLSLLGGISAKQPRLIAQ